LHEKISELANRVRELEDALRASHQHLSNEVHPLLSEELLRVKAPLQRDVSSTKVPTTVAVKEEENNPDVVDAFGTLSIALSGKTKYYGHIANSWVSQSTYCPILLVLSCPSRTVLSRGTFSVQNTSNHIR
jgi:hypothetical protein